MKKQAGGADRQRQPNPTWRGSKRCLPAAKQRRRECCHGILLQISVPTPGQINRDLHLRLRLKANVCPSLSPGVRLPQGRLGGHHHGAGATAPAESLIVPIVGPANDWAGPRAGRHRRREPTSSPSTSSSEYTSPRTRLQAEGLIANVEASSAASNHLVGLEGPNDGRPPGPYCTFQPYAASMIANSRVFGKNPRTRSAPGP